MELKSSMHSLESLKEVSPQVDNIFQMLHINLPAENAQDDASATDDPEETENPGERNAVHVPSFKGVELTVQINIDGFLSKNHIIISSLISSLECRFINTDILSL